MLASYRRVSGSRNKDKVSAGERKRAEGYSPCFPVIIVHGFCSSGLEV
jgi:hypothetical protein